MTRLLISLILSSGLTLAAADLQPKDRIVVVISIDGFPASAWNDPRLPMPALRELARSGVQAEGMAPPNPTVTWPSHTSIITGVSPARHGVIFNGLPVRLGDRAPVKIEPWRPKEELVLAPTLYDYLYRAGFTTAEVDWVAITKAPTITWSFPEIPDVEGAVEKEMIAQSIISSEEVRTFMKSSPPWRDEQWTRAAIHILVNHRPNLLLFHLLNPDAVNHTAGPGSWSSSTAYALADFHLRMLLDAVDEAGLRPRTTFFVISDHGFKKAAKVVRLNSFLRQHGHITGTGATMTCDAYALGGGGSAIVYITDRQDHTAVRTSLLEELRGLEGVARVFEPDAFPALGLPPPAPEGRMGDLFVTAAEGYAFASGDDSPIVTPVWEGAYPGHHGYLNTDPELLSNFIASGAGISPGKKIGVIRAVDFAPTVARLFNLLMPAVEGRVVEEIFDGAP